MGSRVKKFRKKKTRIHARDTSERNWKVSQGIFAQDEMTVKVELVHGIGSLAHERWCR